MWFVLSTLFHGVFGFAWSGFGANPAAAGFKGIATADQNMAAGYGATAAGEGANLGAFDLAKMRETNAFSPTSINQMLTAAEGGAGGAFGGAEGALKANAARTGNATALGKDMMDMAMQRGKAAAGAGEGIAATNAQQVKADQEAGAAGMQGLYGTNVGAQLSAMKGATEAEQGYMQSQGRGILGNVEDISNTAANAYAAICPAEGSMYLMHNGTEKPVEALVVGDLIAGIDEEPQIIEEIQSAYIDILCVTTENGCVLRNSYIHAFALPKGGFTVAAKSLGKIILTAEGPSKIVSVEPAGKAWVFNVITNGSHTYRADGAWGLGVGEAERSVGMNTWAIINRNAVAKAAVV
jgi:hypothetical protein